MNREVMFSRKSDLWSTPQETFDALDREFNFTLDAAADETNHKCERFFSADEDGLKMDWGGQRVFCNPPYSNIKEWVKKCYEEALKPNTIVVLLIPARTDTRYFHDYIIHRSEIRFIKGRLRFGEAKTGAPFPSMIVIFRAAGM